MLKSAAVEETAASYGALNTAAEKTASAKPAADIAGEQPASSEIITSEDQNTVTLKLVSGGTAPTTNGLMSVSCRLGAEECHWKHAVFLLQG